MATETTALATSEYPKLAALTGFSHEQINLIRQTVASGANIIEVAWYLYNANRLGLEPTLDQIYLIKYAKDQPAEIVVGINGYRAMADSSQVYAGSDEPTYEYEDVGQPQGAPSKATVTVWKIVQGQRVPFTASARWEEFYPGDGKIGEQYRKRPHNQLAIRAESHALRKGFPYQAARFEAQPAPSMWIEAAQADEAHNNSPALMTRNAAMYDRTIRAQAETELPMSQRAVENRAAAEPPLPAASAGRDEEASPVSPSRRPTDEELKQVVADYRKLLNDAKRKLGDSFNAADWTLRSDATVEEIETKGVALGELMHAPEPPF